MTQSYAFPEAVFTPYLREKATIPEPGTIMEAPVCTATRPAVLAHSAGVLGRLPYVSHNSLVMLARGVVPWITLWLTNPVLPISMISARQALV